MCDVGNVCKDETWNADMKLDDSLTEGIAVTRKVAMEMLFLDSTILPLDDDHLRSRSNFFAVLGSTRNHDPHKVNSPDHHSTTILGKNCIVDGWIESATEGVKKSLEQKIRLLRKSMRKPCEETVYPLHLRCSSDRACIVSDNQKTYQDAVIHLHGALKKNKGNFCNNEASTSDKAGQKHVTEDGHQYSCHAEYEVSSNEQIGLCHINC